MTTAGPLPGPALGPTDGRPSWRERVVSQQPNWPDQAQADVVARELARQPPLVFAGECDALKERLAAVTRGEAFVLIRVQLASGRCTQVKRAFYARVAELLGERAAVRSEDLMIVLVENGREDWSFGGGIADYVEKPREQWR